MAPSERVPALGLHAGGGEAVDLLGGGPTCAAVPTVDGATCHEVRLIAPAGGYRALPGPVIDLIRDGLPVGRLRDKGALFGALVSTAMSAQNCGQSEVEWTYLVMEPASLLGRQVRLRGRGRARTEKDVCKMLSAAWERAWEHRSSEDPHTRGDVARRAVENAEVARRIADDPGWDLGEADRRVLRYAADEMTRRRMTKVTLPRRAVTEGAEVGEKEARNALRRLHEANILVKVRDGRSGEDPGRRRAAIYELSDWAAGRPAVPIEAGEPAYGTPATATRNYGTSTIGNTGTHDRYGTPDEGACPGTAGEGPQSMTTLTVTVTENERAVMLQALAAARTPAGRDADLPLMQEQRADGAGGVVVPLRSTRVGKDREANCNKASANTVPAGAGRTAQRAKVVAR